MADHPRPTRSLLRALAPFFLTGLAACSQFPMTATVVENNTNPASSRPTEPAADAEVAHWLAPSGFTAAQYAFRFIPPLQDLAPPPMSGCDRIEERVDLGGEQTGVASWYGKRFHGRAKANGERFDMNALTAAHPTLPFDSRVLVTNLDNGRAVVVRITDRGPHSHGRIIDLSYAAADNLDMVRGGTARVSLRLASDPPGSQADGGCGGPTLRPASWVLNDLQNNENRDGAPENAVDRGAEDHALLPVLGHAEQVAEPVPGLKQKIHRRAGSNKAAVKPAAKTTVKTKPAAHNAQAASVTEVRRKKTQAAATVALAGKTGS